MCIRDRSVYCTIEFRPVKLSSMFLAQLYYIEYVILFPPWCSLDDDVRARHEQELLMALRTTSLVRVTHLSPSYHNQGSYVEPRVPASSWFYCS